MDDQEFEIHELNDNSKLMLIPTESNTFGIFMCVKYGSLNLTSSDDYECAHFLEHLFACLPSPKYPDSQANDTMFSEYGMFNNAYTYPEKTIYEYRGLKQYADKVIDLLINAYNNFKIDESVFEQEKNAVLNELKKILSQPLHVVDEYLDDFLYQHHDVRKKCTVRASYENTKNISKEKLYQVWSNYYAGSNILFCITGGFNKKKILSNFKNLITSTRKPLLTPKQPSLFLPETPVSLKLTVKAIEMNMIRVLWVLPFSFFNHKKMVRLWFIHRMMCSGLTSRLYKKLRTELGLVYSVGASVTKTDDKQIIFTVHTQVDNSERVEEVIQIITNSFEQFEPVTEQELSSIKNLVTFKMEEELQQRLHSGFWFEQYHEYVLFDKPFLTRTQYRKYVTKMTTNKLNRLVNKYFSSKHRITLVSSP